MIKFAVSDGKGLIYNNIEDQKSIKVIDTKTTEVNVITPAQWQQFVKSSTDEKS